MLISKDYKNGFDNVRETIPITQMLTEGISPYTTAPEGTRQPRTLTPLLNPLLNRSVINLTSWSGYSDLNRESPAPKAGGLPNFPIFRWQAYKGSLRETLIYQLYQYIYSLSTCIGDRI